jgi:hypothetical protein
MHSYSKVSIFFISSIERIIGVMGLTKRVVSARLHHEIIDQIEGLSVCLFGD